MLARMDKQTFIAMIHASHEPLAAAVASVPDAAWTDPLPDMDGWTRKDALAHVAWWSDHSADVIAGLREGRIPEEEADIGIDAQNRAILEAFRDRDAADVRAYEAEAFERLVAAVEATSDEDLFTPKRFASLEEETLAGAVEWDSTKHYPDHVKHVAA